MLKDKKILFFGTDNEISRKIVEVLIKQNAIVLFVSQNEITDVNILDNFIVVHDCHNYFTQFFDNGLKFIYQVGGKGQNVNQFDLPVSGYAVNDELNGEGGQDHAQQT